MPQVVERHAEAAVYPFAPAPAHFAASAVLEARRSFEWGVVARVIGATIVPGIPFLVARLLLHQRSGLLNMDFFLLTLLACFGHRKVASVLFVVTNALECMRVLDSIYWFSQLDSAYAIHFLGEVPRWLVVIWVATFGLVVLVLFKVWQMLLPTANWTRLRRPAFLVAGLLAVMLLVDLAQGFNPLQPLPHAKPRPHLVGELLLRMPVVLLTHSPQHYHVKRLTESGTSPLWSNSAAFQQAHDNVVVVVVESMGRLQDEAAYRREFSTFSDPNLQQHYRVTEGSVPFDGATVAGEMRELCHLDTGVHIQDRTFAGQPPCLPEQFRQLGYQTVAFHGFRGRMFQRRTWYPKLGFEETNFLREMKDVPRCNGIFFGVCDQAIAGLMEQRLVDKTAAHAPPQFLYWMTLNGHLPVDIARAPKQPCPIQADKDVCAQLAYTEEVLAAVKNLALDPRIGHTAIVVVGDHAPPYISIAQRNLFNDSSVPFVTLIPKA